MSIPGISWAPIFIILLGFGDPVILLVAIITAVFPAAYYTWHGLLALDIHQKQLTDLLQYNTFQRYTNFVFPAIANYLVIELRPHLAHHYRHRDDLRHDQRTRLHGNGRARAPQHP